MVVEPWIDGLWPVLCKHLGIDNTPISVTDAAQNSNGTEDIRTCAEDSNGVASSEDNKIQKQELDQTTSSDKSDQIKTESVLRTVNDEGPRTIQPTSGGNAENGSDEARTKEAEKPTDCGTSKVSESGDTTGATQNNGPCLTCSVPPLSESGLTMPLLPPPYLQVQFQQDVEMVSRFVEIVFHFLPGA